MVILLHDLGRDVKFAEAAVGHPERKRIGRGADRAVALLQVGSST
jgi:hypothetical protein